WLVTFAVVVAVSGWFAVDQAGRAMTYEARSTADHFVRLRTNLLSTFDAMHANLTAEPCSGGFQEQLRRIAYLPDGLNEFLYAPGGRARCSTSVQAFDGAVELGTPDIGRQGERGIAMWVDRDLSFVGLAGERGTIALSEPFAAIIPPQDAGFRGPDWMAMQAVLVAED